MKERLNLTVTSEFKKRAAELAKRRRRSISALFEDLIEEAMMQTERTMETPTTDYDIDKKRPKPIGFNKLLRGVRSAGQTGAGVVLAISDYL